MTVNLILVESLLGADFKMKLANKSLLLVMCSGGVFIASALSQCTYSLQTCNILGPSFRLYCKLLHLLSGLLSNWWWWGIGQCGLLLCRILSTAPFSAECILFGEPYHRLHLWVIVALMAGHPPSLCPAWIPRFQVLQIMTYCG